MDELREEADRIQAELAVAEREWQEWVTARSRVGEVPTPADGTGQDHAGAGQSVPATERQQSGKPLQLPQAAKPKSQVPMWREGLAWSVLSLGYQRILQVAADPGRGSGRGR